MARPFLKAKFDWECGDRANALAVLEDLVSGGEGPAVYAPETFVEDRAERTFENVVIELLSSRHRLVVPFEPAVSRLWEAFPAQYVIGLLDHRQRAEGDAGDAARPLLEAAASDGMLSRSLDDYGRVGKIVLREEDQPALAEAVDGLRLEALMRDAANDGAWGRWAGNHSDLVADLLLYAVFHRVPEMDRSMVLDGLERVAKGQPEVLDIAADALAARTDDADAVRTGMRLHDPACLDRLVDGLRRRDFAVFAERCLLD